MKLPAFSLAFTCSLALLSVLGGCLGENRRIERKGRATTAAVTSRDGVAFVQTRGITWDGVDGVEFWPKDQWDVRPIHYPGRHCEVCPHCRAEIMEARPAPEKAPEKAPAGRSRLMLFDQPTEPAPFFYYSRPGAIIW